MISARDKEVADLRIVVGQSETKFYNMGFVDAENSSEPIMLESRCCGFEEGWMISLNTLSLLEDSPFRDPNQVPYPKKLLPRPVQTPTQNEEEDNLNMRELVEEINSYAKVNKLDMLSNPVTVEGQMPPSTQSNLNP